MSKILYIAVLLFTASLAQNCGCSSNECCSQYGYCGTTADYCEPSNKCKQNCWAAKCSDGCSSAQCCSVHGWCGITSAFCGAGNCTSNCWGATTKQPTPTNPTPTPTTGNKFIGYYASWTAQASCPITPEKIPADKYTHINFAFASFDARTGAMQDVDVSLVNRLIAMKQRNNKLKIMCSLGGGGFGAGPWTQLLSSKNATNNFYNSINAWLNKYGFDGLDIDWEFPADGEQDKVVDLFKNLRSKLGNKLLTSAGPSAWSLPQYVPEKWVQYVDFINVMNYDYAGSWTKATGNLAPLYGSGSIDATMKAYVQRGCPANKLVFGFANYAVTFQVDGANGLNKPSHNPGVSGKCSNTAGYLSATELQDLLKNKPSGFTLSWDDTAKVPYATWGNQFVSFEDAKSTQAKTDYIKQNKFGGGMLWVIDANTVISDLIWAQLK